MPPAGARCPVLLRRADGNVSTPDPANDFDWRPARRRVRFVGRCERHRPEKHFSSGRSFPRFPFFFFLPLFICYHCHRRRGGAVFPKRIAIRHAQLHNIYIYIIYICMYVCIIGTRRTVRLAHELYRYLPYLRIYISKKKKQKAARGKMKNRLTETPEIY